MVMRCQLATVEWCLFMIVACTTSSLEMLASPAIASGDAPNHIFVQYDRTIFDSKAKTDEKARQLEIVEGVRNASALICAGMVVISCDSVQKQTELMHDLVAHPHVEFASHSNISSRYCSSQPDLDADFEHVSLPFEKLEDVQATPAPEPTMPPRVEPSQDAPTRLAIQEIQEREGDARTARADENAALSEATQALDARLNDSSNEGTHDAEPLDASVMIPGLDYAASSDSRFPQIIARGIASSLAHGVVQADVAILNITRLNGRAAVVELPHKATASRRLRARGGVKVTFRYAPPANISAVTYQQILGQLHLLTSGGRAVEHFDVALDTELAIVGAVLPDDSKAYFKEYKHLVRRRKDNHHQDTESEAAIVLLILLFFVFATFFSAGVVGCVLTSL